MKWALTELDLQFFCGPIQVVSSIGPSSGVDANAMAKVYEKRCVGESLLTHDYDKNLLIYIHISDIYI